MALVPAKLPYNIPFIATDDVLTTELVIEPLPSAMSPAFAVAML